MFTHKYRYLLIVALAVYSYLNTLFLEVYTYYHIDVQWYVLLAAFIFITVLIWEGNRFIQRAISNNFSNISHVSFLALFFLCGALLASLVAVVTVFGLNALFIQVSPPQLKISLKLALIYSTRINLFLHILNAIVYYLNQYKIEQLETEQLKRISSQAQLQAIKNQVNPHFLFNNLNVLSTLVMQENPDANAFIEALSKVYRHVLNAQQHELITLQVELEFLHPYTYLLQKRFPESIFIRIDIPPEYYSYYIIPVAVQMLVENAIKHNITSRQKPLQVSLSVDSKNRLVVLNNLQLKNVITESTHIGLENIARRYELIAHATIDIQQTDKTFSVSLPLIQPNV